MTSSKPIEKGSYVRADAHPEYGVGRVLAIDAFSTRVLFPVGGVRVYRNSDVGRIKGVATPSEEDQRALEDKEANMRQGIVEHMAKAKPEPAPKKKRKKA